MLYAVVTNRRFMMHFGEYVDIHTLFRPRCVHATRDMSRDMIRVCDPITGQVG